jgi:hypothetical protein
MEVFLEGQSVEAARLVEALSRRGRQCDLLRDALEKIRDSTYRDAASLRAIADDALNQHRKNGG